MRARSHRPPGVAPCPPPADPFPWSAWWMYALIVAATLLAYRPVLKAGIIWDDAGHITRTDLRGLDGLVRIWFEVGATQQYYPVTHTAFWLEHRLWGDAAAGYHLLNVLLHATAACLFGLLLRRLLAGECDDAPPAPTATATGPALVGWLAALLFAVHPVGVESVAWISEQKNTLSTVLYLAAAGVYLRFDRGRRPAHHALATGLFALALLSKTVTATLPAALLVVFWWRRGRLAWRRDALPLLPWFGLAAAAGALTAWFEHTQIGAQGADFTLSAAQRLLLAGRAVWFYLGKLAWPADLVFIYPRWTLDAAALWQWLFPAAAAALLAGLFVLRHRHRGPLTAFLFFGGSLFPALGFFNVFPFLFSFVADHFQYLASLGIFALAAAGVARGLAHLPRWYGFAAAALLAGTLGTLTLRQTGIYRDAFTLYETTLARNPACWMAHNNLAIALSDSGRLAEAVSHLEAALRLRPAYPEAENNLGDFLTRLSRPAEALPHLERALQLKPDYPEAHNNLGTALMLAGRGREGVAAFERAVQLRPGFAIAWLNLGLALAAQGRSTEALSRFEQAVRHQPTLTQARLNLGFALLLGGRAPEAVKQFEAAVGLAPEDSETHRMLGRAHAQAGRPVLAIAAFEAALVRDPASIQAHLDLAVTLEQAGRTAEASGHFDEARRLKQLRGN